MSQSKLLKRLYYDPQTGYISAQKLYKKAREYDPLITLKTVKDRNIEHFNNEAGEHNTLGKIERFNRTVKQRLEKINRKLTQKLLDDVMKNYNSTEHSSVNATPNEMKDEAIQSELDHNQQVMNQLSNDFNIGDHVRCKLHPKAFGKESVKWSKSVYQIVGIDGYKFQIRSKNNHVLYKSANELKVVDVPLSTASLDNNQLWEVEKIIDHKTLTNGKYKYLVKWRDFKEPSWEPQGHLRLVNKNKQSSLETEYFPGK